jgi:hypothetical protein
MRALLPWLTAGLLWACSGTEGPLLVRRGPTEFADGGSRDANAAGTDASSPPRAAIRQNMTLQYQITGTLDVQVDADFFVVDLFDTQSAEVMQLHSAGRLVIAYVSVGTREAWRSDASQFPRSAVGDPLPEYPNEAWLDVRNADVRRLMRARFQRAADKGFDGIFASTVGAYRQNTGLSLTRADELDYHEFLADTAHELGLTIGLSGDFELSQELASHYDFAIATRCVARDTCGDLGPLQARGVPVFDLETDGDKATVCSRAASFKLPVTFKSIHYDATRSVCP